MKKIYLCFILLLLIIPISNALFFDKNYFLMTGMSTSSNVSINCADGYALQTYNNGVETCISINGSSTNMSNYTTFNYVNSLGNWSGNQSLYVPYTGATANVDLGNYNLIATNVSADNSFSIANTQIGICFNGTDFNIGNNTGVAGC